MCVAVKKGEGERFATHKLIRTMCDTDTKYEQRTGDEREREKE